MRSKKLKDKQAATQIDDVPLGSEALSAPWLRAQLNLADMIGSVSHDLNNVLNSIALQASGLSRVLPAEFRERVAGFRVLALQAGRMLGRLDEYRGRVRPPTTAADFSDLARRVAAEAQARGVAVQLMLADALPKVHGSGVDVTRLLELLVNAAHEAGGPVIVRARHAGANVEVAVEDAGPTVPEQALGSLYEPFGTARPGDGLERAAALAIAQRLHATLEARNLPERGLAVTFALPAVADQGV